MATLLDPNDIGHSRGSVPRSFVMDAMRVGAIVCADAVCSRNACVIVDANTPQERAVCLAHVVTSK